MADHSDEILTIDEVAAYLKASRRTVYRLAAGGADPWIQTRWNLALPSRRIRSVDCHPHWRSDC